MSALETYSVVGYWAGSEERYVQFFEVHSVRDAEEQMLAKARDEDDVFWISGTMLDEQYRDDLYTAFINPDDPENDNRTDLQAVVDELGVEEWTVSGLVVSTTDKAWNARTGGERYLGRQMALNPRIAEDLARMAVRERPGLDLIVCAVFKGVRNRCEPFPFANHDERVQH